MKKVTNITLGGRVFAVEEDAFLVLSGYLSSIETTFAGSPDYAEIASDIEHAIADKFSAKERSEKFAVTKEDVDEVVAAMGTAAEVGGEEPRTEAGTTTATPTSDEPSAPRRLYRNPDDAILGGVASGMASYFAIDPVIVRLGFVLLTFLNGIGIIAYIILWLIVPEAKTTTEKYAMRGEGMTVSDITNRVKKNLADLDERYAGSATGAWQRIRRLLVQMFELTGTLVKALFVIARYMIGIGFIIAGALGIAVLVGSIGALLLSGGQYANPQVAAIYDLLVSIPNAALFLVAGAITAFIPVLVTIVFGVGIVNGRNPLTVAKFLTLLVAWLSAVAFLTALITMHAEQVESTLHAAEHILRSEPEVYLESEPTYLPDSRDLELPEYQY